MSCCGKVRRDEIPQIGQSSDSKCNGKKAAGITLVVAAIALLILALVGASGVLNLTHKMIAYGVPGVMGGVTISGLAGVLLLANSKDKQE